MTLRAVAFGLIAALPVFASSLALGDVTKDQCVDANSQAQTLRREGKLHAARAALKTCVDPSCPGLVRDDCTQRLDDLERVQPTVIFAAKDRAGHDLVTVKVTMDGQPLVDKLDGTAVPVDVGEHSFKFEIAGQPAVEQKFVLREGEKGRREAITLGPAATPTATATATSEPPPSPGKTQKIIAVVVGGVGVAGLVVGGIMGASASSSWSSSQSECASPTNCTNHAQAVSDHDSATSAATVSTVAFIGGGALLVTGAILWFMAPKGAPQTGVRVMPSVGTRGGGLVIGGGF